MAPLGRPLVTLAHADGTAAVLRDDEGSTWLTGAVEHLGGTQISTAHGAIEGLSDGRMVQGGLLPEGASRAEVVDVAGRRIAAQTGEGAWVVVLDGPMHGPAAVRFADDAGQTVRPELPAEWPREPVPDALDPCPACGVASWEEVTPLDDSRGMFGSDDDMQPTPIVVCVACGHEIPSGGWISVALPGEGDEDTEAEREALVAAWREQRRAEERGILERIAIPVHVLAGWDGPRSLGGWGRSGGRIASITVTHGDEGGSVWASVELETGAWPHPQEPAARERLAGLARGDEPWPGDRSRRALSVWLDAQERAALRTAMAAQAERVAVTVDGEPREAVVVRDGDRLACVLDNPTGRLTITARGLAPGDLALRRLPDPAALLEP